MDIKKYIAKKANVNVDNVEFWGDYLVCVHIPMGEHLEQIAKRYTDEYTEINNTSSGGCPIDVATDYYIMGKRPSACVWHIVPKSTDYDELRGWMIAKMIEFTERGFKVDATTKYYWLENERRWRLEFVLKLYDDVLEKWRDYMYDHEPYDDHADERQREIDFSDMVYGFNNR